MKNAKKLQALVKRLIAIKDELEDLLELEESVHEKMDDTYYSRTEAWQESDKGQEFYDRMTKQQEDISTIEDGINELDSCIMSLDIEEN